MTESAKIVGVLLIVGVLATAFALVLQGRLEAGLSPVDTDGVGFDLCKDTDAATKNLRGFGHFDDRPGDRRLRGEVFSTTRLWHAWFKDGESRPVTVEARTENCPAIGIDFYPDRVHYVFAYSEDGRSWQRFYQDRLPRGEYVGTLPGTGIGPTGSFELIVDGFEFCLALIPFGGGCPTGFVKTIIDGAALRVQVLVSRVAFPSWPDKPETNGYLIVEDQIELRSAVPELEWSKGGYKVGETAILDWRIPVDVDDQGNPTYFLSVRDMNTGLPIVGYDRKALSGTTGAEKILITEGMFSNVLATCQNRLRAEILSQIIVADQDDATVKSPDVTIGGEAPVITAITFDKPEYFEGDRVTITWTARGTVTKFHVTAHIGGLLVYDQDVKADVTTVSFNAPRTGVLEVEVTGYNLCAPSDVREEQATVGNFYPGLCNAYPDLPQCTSQNIIAIIVAVLAAIAVLLTFIFLAWILTEHGDKVRLPPFVGILIAVVGAGVLAIVLAGAGAFDGFLLLGAGT